MHDYGGGGFWLKDRVRKDAGPSADGYVMSRLYNANGERGKDVLPSVDSTLQRTRCYEMMGIDCLSTEYVPHLTDTKYCRAFGSDFVVVGASNSN